MQPGSGTGTARCDTRSHDLGPVRTEGRPGSHPVIQPRIRQLLGPSSERGCCVGKGAAAGGFPGRLSVGKGRHFRGRATGLQTQTQLE